ncbi:hypothetical protein Micbo1qcDRAFT_208448 [Microdochium bolleyi]|uniref:Succinate dehydrogenase assembly factor 4, mitochondrial n=1 Tax=Microdochium bolleyi TaxID=196109 RepID=A0A136IQ76_9PEZI|nr:hypothetical protein Micbo1qcDRAFT_208448 [Microdochium bolleyi]
MATALRSRLLALTGRRIIITPPSSSSSATLSRTTRPYSSSSSPWETGPSPPRLSAAEQAEFERLQRTANTQEGFNPSATPADFVIPSTPTATKATATTSTTIIDDGNGGVAPTPLRKGAPPEFEGETNPKTGEVGGPKNEPLRWGAGGDYSYNGRVTDF